MFYPVDSSFTVIVFYMMVVGLPLLLIMKGIAWWIVNSDQERKADAYIKRVLGEK